ncbi:MAG: hypothetical protein AB200_01315 [Parcubacteria bacterium C7867-005]|nr:MAG: hypothetical protein AB200_01315 [Parcubacteria bacterium C7867-005]
MKEIEILIEVKSDKETALRALGGFDSLGVKKTLDVYFYDPLRKNLQPDEENRLSASFRIRQKGEKCSMAYKIDHFILEEWSHSDEYETEIEDLETAIKIVENFGLKELVRIDNEKYIYTTPEYEIVLEDVKNLGLFMEVEKIGKVGDDEVASTKEEIRSLLKSLKIEFGPEQNAGKPELMLRRSS